MIEFKKRPKQEAPQERQPFREALVVFYVLFACSLLAYALAQYVTRRG